MSLIDFKEICSSSDTPLTLAVTTIVISLILCLTSIVGNILIIIAVVVDPNKNLQRPFSWLIVNLAVADLIAGAITDPLMTNFHFKICLGKKLNNRETTVLNASFFISTTASALTIASLAFERYLSVRKPNTYRNTVTNKRIVFTVIAIWLISFASLIMYLKLGYVLSSFINVNASFILATSMSCFMYFLMWRKLKERNKANHNTRATSFSLTTQEQQQGSLTAQTEITRLNRIVKSRNEIEEKVTKMFLVVLVAMFCCYGSSTLFSYLLNFCESCSCHELHWFLDLACNLVLLNSSSNFLCYAMQSSRFRSAFIMILKKKKKVRYNPSRFSNVANNREAAFITREVEEENNTHMNSVIVKKANSGAEHYRHDSNVKIISA